MGRYSLSPHVSPPHTKYIHVGRASNNVPRNSRISSVSLVEQRASRWNSDGGGIVMHDICLVCYPARSETSRGMCHPSIMIRSPTPPCLFACAHDEGIWLSCRRCLPALPACNMQYAMQTPTDSISPMCMHIGQVGACRSPCPVRGYLCMHYYVPTACRLDSISAFRLLCDDR